MAKNNNPGRILKGTKSQPSLKGASGVWTLDEALQAHRANQWPQPNLFQPVANSLRIKYQIAGTYPTYQNGYLYRYPGRTGNQYAWTWSAWIKYSQGGIAACILGATTGSAASGDYRTQFIIDKSGSVSFGYAQIQIATYINFVWPLYLRDPSAWYHIVLVFDSLNSTTANRLRLYVNGVQQTATTTTCPQGQVSSINGGVGVSGSSRQSVGMSNDYYGNSAYWYDGLMSEVNFVDGYTLQPTQFGQYDNNNAWVPIPYTGSYGTNGYYLPFTNATTSQTLGYDASLNGTTTYNADQDPYRGSVALHLTGNGPAGGNNTTFNDSSSTNAIITTTGNPAQGSFSPYPFNTNAPYNASQQAGSCYFGYNYSGTVQNSVQIANSAGINFSGQFTIEFWCWQNQYGAQSNNRFMQKGSNSTAGFCILTTTSSNLVYFGRTDENLVSFTQDLRDSAWHHIAVTRQSDNYFRIYLDGVLKGTSASTYSDNLNNTGSLFLGAYPGDGTGTGNQRYAGYLAGVRIINGAAIYTAAFTPTNRPFGTLTNNVLTWSEDFASSSYWTQYNGTSITSGSTIAPDGTPSGWLWTSATGAASFRGLYLTPTLSSSVYTFSVYLKYKGVQWVALDLGGSSSFSSIDLLNGVTGTTASGRTTTINSVGNGWYRCTITSTSAITGSQETGVWQLDANGGTTSIGSANNGFYIWGAQLEAASSATNYTPTPANYSTAPAVLMNFANAAIVDSTGATDVVVTGGATITSASKTGSGAIILNNTGANQTDYLNIQNCDCYFPGDFTVEFWFNPQYISTSWSDFGAILDLSASISTDYSWWVIHQVNQTLYWATNGGTLTAGNANILQTGNVLLTSNTWYHVALVRNQTNLSFYVNGILSATVSSNAAIGSRRALTVGAQNSSSTRFTRGSIDDLRITKGLARYTTSFTPPARALPETGGKSFVTTNVNAGVVRSFTTTGTTSWTAPIDVSQVEILVVAGGGGGGCNNGGGGGGGGVVYNNSYPVTPGQTYTVTVGAGGTPNTSSSGFTSQGNTGSNSQFGNLTAIGGGGGGGQGGPGAGGDGKTGGSGGGTGNMNSGGGTVGFGTAGQGFNGGLAAAGSYSQAAGGGGAGQLGFSFGGGTAAAGAGGSGLQFGISGTPTYYAGGGGGASSPGSAGQGAGGIGGGGAGVAGNGVSGTANTGGGGGGCTNAATGGTGGTGIVLIRYTTTAVGNTSDATTDNLTDSPTLYGHDTGAGGEVVGNYATWNPLIGANYNNSSVIASSIVVLSNGNLNAYNPALSGSAPKMQCHSTIGMTTGKWYAEFTGLSGRGAGISLGDYLPAGGSGSGVSNSLILQPTSGTVTPATGATATVTGTAVAISTTDVVGVAFDVDNRVCYYYRNGVLTQTASSITTTLGTPYFSSGVWYFSSQPESSGSASSIVANFGQRAWAYTPPQGFNALTTKNLPRPAVGSAAATPNQFFDTVLYTGNGTNSPNALTISSLNFQPDLVWIKNRTSATDNWLQDTVRGLGYALNSNTTSIDIVTGGGDVSAVNSTGFVVSYANSRTNASANNYVAWCWKAGGAAVANTAGTITSQVSANTTSGFSVVTYTGNNTAGATVGHGLGSIPNMIIVFRRDSTAGHKVWHSSLTAGQVLELQVTNGVQTIAAFNNAVPTSTTFALGAYVDTNASAGTFVAYCWTAIPGFSQFGSYAANGSADGPFVYTGFKPRWIMMKRYDSGSAESWFVVDTARDPGNYGTGQHYLLLQSTAADGTGTAILDVLSNGFKLRSTATNAGAGGPTYVYMAFASTPFTNTNGTAF